jgi:carboxyl-terminal processing protease
MLKRYIFTFALCLWTFLSTRGLEGKLPEISAAQVNKKLQEIMHEHASHKQLTPQLIRRMLTNFIDELDPTKTYFLESDIHTWLEPSENSLDKISTQFQRDNFQVFEDIHATLLKAIKRRKALEIKIDVNNLPKHVKAEEFKDMKWCTTEAELLTRLERMKALQYDATTKLSPSAKEKSLQRIAKRQTIFEDEMQEKSLSEHKKRLHSYILKAGAAALDAHTAYFNPDEATQFMINVQQRLVGIGAQLRDDINGFTIVKIIEGGPAWRQKDIKTKDKIIAVNGEPVVGMDIVDAVELIRGPENTSVVLTIVRENADTGKEDILDITVVRSEVVLKETRYESAIEPYGDGAIGYLRLYSFYQDADSSSGSDLSAALKKMREQAPLKALVLDLRSNSGGLLSQAVEVAGLFISKGIVVSIKDEHGQIQHLRHLDEEKAWSGPLVVLTNRASASASEIVAGTLQDYGRALIIGDDRTYGKGSFQTFTLNAAKAEQINPEGEYKVTRGRYYTVSGRTPQLTGVFSDIKVAGPLSESDVGEKFAKYPLENDSIKDNFDDDLSDVPVSQRDKIRMLYKFNLQPKLNIYDAYLPILAKNSAQRIENNKIYQEFLKGLKKDHKESDKDEEEPSEEEGFAKSDLQLTESYNIVKDLLYLMLKESIDDHKPSALTVRNLK